ncbi:MAG: phosphoribosylformylglycinamidine synthase, partial [Acutalibacteraceae bacterium]
MVYRVYTEKKNGLTAEADSLTADAKNLLMIDGIEKIRILNRYDVENIDPVLFERSKSTVFAEPQLDNVYDRIGDKDGCKIFAVEYLPGQFDQRADSASQCIQIISKGERPLVRTAKIYMIYGDVSVEGINTLKKYVINPVESREASLESVETLAADYEIPTQVAVLDGFCSLDEEGLAEFVNKYSLAMDLDDIRFCRDYFRQEKRDPTITEIRMIDTYWSDHCRHTTFLTTIDSAEFEDELLDKAFKDYLKARENLDRTKPINLMDIATIATKYLNKNGKLP